VRKVRLALGAWWLATAIAAPAHAQIHRDTLRKVMSKSQFVSLVGVTAAIEAAYADERLAHWMRRPGAQVPALQSVADVFNFAGDPGTVIGSVGIYAFGAVAHRRGVMDAGLHIGESVVAASTITGALKMLVGRARPYVSADSNSYDFGFMRGRKGGQYQSFPSGHTTAAFAFAAALAGEANTVAKPRRWVAPVVYSAATLVGLARMYDDKHWASDVIVGGSIGFFTARATVRYNHLHPSNWINRLLLPATGSDYHLSVWRSANGRTNVGLARGW